jgi:hypothetical protein
MLAQPAPVEEALVGPKAPVARAVSTAVVPRLAAQGAAVPEEVEAVLLAQQVQRRAAL